MIIFLGNLDHLNASLKLWIQWGVGNHERLISINYLYQYLCISLSKALPCFHSITGCDYTPAFFRKGKLRPFKLLEKSVEYQLACQEIITDHDDELERIFATLEKFVCHMYGVPNSSNVNDVRFYLFSKTYQSKELDDNFEKKCRSFDSSSLPPCKAELYQHLLRVRYMTKFWRNAHLKNPSSLSPLASGWIVNDDKYDFVRFSREQFPSSAADIVIKNSKTRLENALTVVITSIGNKHIRTATAGSDVVQSGRPIFDDFFQHLWPYIGNNTANAVFQMVKRLWLIRIDQ
ncbi:uncharacterized protein TNCV_1879191 [Trichonephila clavipes]|nr:uncharacterized protein TNCV_1879191 [Trichonephila clavipes]